MLFQGFVHPLLAWGALAALVPLLIHLLNRQRHKPMQWAAMTFVIAAYKKTRRRAQLENLILLMLRMAAVGLLALAIARPFTGDDSPLAPLTESRRDLVLVLDTSASTGYRENVRSVHEGIVERALEILEEFDGSRGDRVRLIAASDRARLISARSPEDALSLLSTLSEPTDEALDLGATLAEIVDLAEEEAAGTESSALEVRLLSDLQRSTFQPAWNAESEESDDAPTDRPVLQDALDRLAELGVRVVVEDLGAGVTTPPNVGIVSVGPLTEILGAGITNEILVRVQNFGASGRGALRVALEVDGVRLPSSKIDIGARESADVIFPVVFKSSGPHTLVGKLEGDRFAADDTRTTVVVAPEPMRVLLVNGDAHPEIDRDELGYLRAILEPPTGGDSVPTASSLYSPFAVSVVDASSFGVDERALADFDLIVLANVSSISSRVMKLLEERVAAGVALFITLGDRSSDEGAIEAMNTRAWRADGTGLLPAKLYRRVEVPSRRTAYYRCAEFDVEHPALEFFADERWRPFLTEVPIYAFVEVQPIQNASVLARLDDEGNSPLLIEREYGRGRVLLWTTSIDRGWNRIADSPSTLIPLIHELFRHATHGQQPPLNVPVSASIALELETFPRNVSLVKPDGTRQPFDGEPLEVSPGLWKVPPIGPLDRAGLWRLEFDGGRLPFTAQFDADEGDLDRISSAELEQEHRTWRIFDPSDAEAESSEDDTERGELWRWLAGLALAALVCETLWSAWIGRGRRLA